MLQIYRYIYKNKVCVFILRDQDRFPRFSPSYLLFFTSPEVQAFSRAHQNTVNQNLLKGLGWKSPVAGKVGITSYL